jgi:predicted nucleotidyltransferase
MFYETSACPASTRHSESAGYDAHSEGGGHQSLLKGGHRLNDSLCADLMSIPNLGMIIPEMGTDPRHRSLQSAPTGLGSVLFTPVQQRVLGLLFGQPDRRFQSSELIRLAASGTGAVHRLLTKLADARLITVERVGNQKHYQANRKSLVFAELHGLIVKTSGLIAPLRTALDPLAKRIDAAFVYGSVAKGKDQASSDIDLMVIADNLHYADVFGALQTVEADLGRTVNPNVMSVAEWRRKHGQAGFVARISGQPRLFVIGSDDDLV